MRVYHGLNRMFTFPKFTAHFTQPISTTTDIITAQQFADAMGIVLTFASGRIQSDTAVIPKFLSVSWSSDFPYENEQLFYGDNVQFQIQNVLETSNNKQHGIELKLMNRVQTLIQNKEIKWEESKDNSQQKENEILMQLIENQKTINKTDEIEAKENGQISEYGQQLFRKFCNHSKTTTISIRNYNSLPASIQTMLFTSTNLNDQDMTNQISLIPIIELFLHVTDLSLTELTLDLMKQKQKSYIKGVLEVLTYIENSNNCGKCLESITFESKSNDNDKQDASLERTATKNKKLFETHSWKISYQRSKDHKHILAFSKAKDSNNNLQYQLQNKQKVKSIWHDRSSLKKIKSAEMKDIDHLTDDTYKPKTINLSTIRKAKDDRNKKVYVSWSRPPQSYGQITYRIHIESEEKEPDKELNVLPYSIPFQSLPISFKVTTISTIKNQAYESEPSQMICIWSLCSPIKEWIEFPNLVQVLSVDDNAIQIKFKSNKQTTKTKYRINIQHMDDKDINRSQLLVYWKGTQINKNVDIEAKENSMYRINIFKNKKQISNSVTVKTSSRDFNPTEQKYSPPSISMKSVKQYYDERKENMLVIWDCPNGVFGDEIVYRIESTHLQKYEDITELPYKISAVFTSVEMKVTTISII
eukprot:464031_1